MFALYRKERSGGGITRYEFRSGISLFGRNAGLIPRLLRQQIPAGQNEPFPWHLDMGRSLELNKEYGKGLTVLIDLKPRNPDNLSLYELSDVWGYSAEGWTPMLFHLRGLMVDVNPSEVSGTRDNFTVRDDEIDEPIYEVLYTSGSIKDGELVGRWASPPRSPTNAVLLWPDALRYFISCIRQRTPGIVP
ncbi:MAG: hypothetical protein AB1609_22320 [Bacillota bacterium]